MRDRFEYGGGYINRDVCDPALRKFKVLTDPGISVGPGKRGGVNPVPLDGKAPCYCLTPNNIMRSPTVDPEGRWIVVADE